MSISNENIQKSPYKRSSNHPLAVSYDSNSNLSSSQNDTNSIANVCSSSDLIFSPKLTIKNSTTISGQQQQQQQQQNELKFELNKTRLQTSLKQPFTNGSSSSQQQQQQQHTDTSNLNQSINKSKKEVKCTDNVKKTSSGSSSFVKRTSSHHHHHHHNNQQQSSTTATDDDDDCNNTNNSNENDYNHKITTRSKNTHLSSSNTLKASNESASKKLRKSISANSAFVPITRATPNAQAHSQSNGAASHHDSSSDDDKSVINNSSIAKNYTLNIKKQQQEKLQSQQLTSASFNNTATSTATTTTSNPHIPFLVQNHFIRINKPGLFGLQTQCKQNIFKAQFAQQQHLNQQQQIILNETDEHDSLLLNSNNSMAINNPLANEVSSKPVTANIPPAPPIPKEGVGLIIRPIERTRRIQSQTSDYSKQQQRPLIANDVNKKATFSTQQAHVPVFGTCSTSTAASAASNNNKKIESSTRLDDSMWPSTSESNKILDNLNNNVKKIQKQLITGDDNKISCSINLSTSTSGATSNNEENKNVIQNVDEEKIDAENEEKFRKQQDDETPKFLNKFIVQKVAEDALKIDLKTLELVPKDESKVLAQGEANKNDDKSDEIKLTDSSKSSSNNNNKTDDENIGEERPIDKTPDNRFLKYATEIGRGAFKTVYKGLDTESGVPIAWCELHDKKFNKQDRQRFKVEAEMLKQLQHPNIVRFYGSYESKKPKKIILITELMTSGTLKTYIQLFQPSKRIKIIKNFAYQILKGLIYLHSRSPPVIHRDLKLDNIFVTGNCGQVKIGDLGLATLKQQSFVKSVIGTPEFMAPEMYTESYDESVDVYAFGMCLLEMVTGEYPYQECTRVFDIYKLVTQGIKPENYKKVENKDLRELIDLCINPKSNQRPTVKELANHSWFLENNGLNLDVVRDTKTNKVENQDEKIIKFHLKTVDRSKRRNPWPENEIIEFIFKVDEESPEDVVKDLSEYGIAEDDTRYLVQAIKDKCFIFKNERNDRREEATLINATNELSESSKNIKKIQEQQQQQQQQHDTLTPTSITTSYSTQLQSTSTTQIPSMAPTTTTTSTTTTTPINTTASIVPTSTNTNTSGYNSSVSVPSSCIDPIKETSSFQQVQQSSQYSPTHASDVVAQQNSITTTNNEIQNVNNQQNVKDEIDGTKLKEENKKTSVAAAIATNSAQLTITTNCTTPSTTTSATTTTTASAFCTTTTSTPVTTSITNINTSTLTNSTSSASSSSSSAKKPISKKSKDIKLTILDLVEVGEVVQCALESEDKKIEFKFGLNSDIPIDIATKLIQAGVFKLATEHTTRMVDLIRDAISYINANKQQIQNCKQKTFMISIHDDKNRELNSETSETELVDVHLQQNANTTNLTPTNQSNSSTPTPQLDSSQQQISYASVAATTVHPPPQPPSLTQQISPTNGASQLGVPSNNMKSNSNSNVTKTAATQQLKVAPIVIPASDSLAQILTAPNIDTTRLLNQPPTPSEKPIAILKPKGDESKSDDSADNKDQNSTKNGLLAEKLKEIFNNKPPTPQDQQQANTQSVANAQQPAPSNQTQPKINSQKEGLSERRKSIELKDVNNESKSPSKQVEIKQSSCDEPVNKQQQQQQQQPQTTPVSEKPRAGSQMSFTDDEKLIEMQNRHRKEIDELLMRQKDEIEEYMMSKLYNINNKNVG